MAASETGEVSIAAGEALSVNDYASVLTEYLREHREQALYQASLLSHVLVESGLGPEDIVALHFEAIAQAIEETSPVDRDRAMADAHQFLLEIMIGYGVYYKQYLELRLQQRLQDFEAKVSCEHERALEAERLGQQRQELLGVIAHELRTPLTAARLHLQLVERVLSQGEVQRAPYHILNAMEAIDRLSRLTADLVEASRGEIPELSLVRIEACEIVHNACHWAQPVVGAKRIALNYVQESPACTVLGNSDALLSVFGNLLSNAVRYTPPGGHVTVRISRADEWLRVAVSDTGTGITADALPRVFEKFYRAPEARRAEPRGLGLGLALVQQVILAHHGRVEVESAPGKGSTFSVFLPPVNDERTTEDPTI